MSAIIDSIDRLQKAEQQGSAKSETPEENSSRDSLFSKLGILLWLGASISATVFSYHLGVNQGLQAAQAESPKEWLNYFSDFAPVQPAPIVRGEERKIAAEVKTPAPQAPAVSESKPAVPAEVKKREGYTIQLITYISERLANEEVAKLSKKGLQAFVVPSGKYYQVCLQTFKDKKAAVQKLAELKKTQAYKTSYPGAYIKLLK